MSPKKLEMMAKVVADLLERASYTRIKVCAADGTYIEVGEEEYRRAVKEGQSSAMLQGFSIELDPELERKRQGAWQTLEGNTSDRHVQAAHSMRETLSQLLDSLAPNQQVQNALWYNKPKEGDPVTRAMKVHYAIAGASVNISTSTLEQINTLSRAVDATYAKLSAEGHQRGTGKDRLTSAYLRACESVMELIVVSEENMATQAVHETDKVPKGSRSKGKVRKESSAAKANLEQLRKWSLSSLERLGIPENFAPLLLGIKEHGAWVSSLASSKCLEERYAEIIVELKRKSPNIPLGNLNALAVIQLQAETLDSDLVKETVQTFLRYEPWRSKNHRLAFQEALKLLAVKHNHEVSGLG